MLPTRADLLDEYSSLASRLGDLRAQWAMVQATVILTRRDAYMAQAASGAGVTECTRVAEHASADMSASLVKLMGFIDETESRLRYLDVALKYGAE